MPTGAHCFLYITQKSLILFFKGEEPQTMQLICPVVKGDTQMTKEVKRHNIKL